MSSSDQSYTVPKAELQNFRAFIGYIDSNIIKNLNFFQVNMHLCVMPTLLNKQGDKIQAIVKLEVL